MSLIKQVARFVRGVPFSHQFYRWIWYCFKFTYASRIFRNPGRFIEAMSRKGVGTEILTTRSGIEIEIRRNIWDAIIVEEVFIDKGYDRFPDLAPNPIVVDVGGYIGDFSLYAAKILHAKQVIVCEPIIENLEILYRNVERNNLLQQITVVPVAVSDSDGNIVIHVKQAENGEIHSSSHLYHGADQRVIPCVCLPTLIKQHGLQTIDLLKIDCEGAEYDIILGTADKYFLNIANLVMEITPIDNYERKLQLVIEKFHRLGYRTTIRESLIFCSR